MSCTLSTDQFWHDQFIQVFVNDCKVWSVCWVLLPTGTHDVIPACTQRTVKYTPPIILLNTICNAHTRFTTNPTPHPLLYPMPHPTRPTPNAPRNASLLDQHPMPHPLLYPMPHPTRPTPNALPNKTNTQNANQTPNAPTHAVLQCPTQYPTHPEGN